MTTAQTRLEKSRDRNSLWIFVVIIATIVLFACQPIGAASKKLPEFPGYLIAGRNENLNFISNQLMIFDTASLVSGPQKKIPNSRIETAELDSKGNLWIGLAGGTSWDDDRVIVLDPSGQQLAEIHACLYPTAGIWFYNDKAYVVCSDTGFISTIAQIDTASFKVERKIEIGIGENQSFVATSSGLSGSYLVVSGATSGPNETLSYSTLITIDLTSFTVYGKMELGSGSNIWSMLPYHEDLYLLNAQGDKDDLRRDVLILNIKKQAIKETLSLNMPSPLWGAISNGALYTYNNGGWNSIFSPSERAICQLNLDTHEQTCQALADNFDAYDLEVIDAKACITHWGGDQPGGLYCLDNNKTLNLSIKFTDASLVVIKK